MLNEILQEKWTHLYKGMKSPGNAIHLSGVLRTILIGISDKLASANP